MSDIKISRTQKALRLIQGEGITAKEAAERVVITSAAVSKGKCHPSKTQQKISMLSEMQEEIKSLRQQLAEKDAVISRLQFALADTEALELGTAERLAASQAREQQLREALEITHDLYSHVTAGYGYYRPDNPHNFSPDLDCCSQGEIAAHSKACEDYKSGRAYGNDSWGIGAYCDEYLPALDALALPSDTTALSAMITKAGEVMRESVIEQCIAMGAMSRDGAFVEEIRALTGVTLDDLK